LIVLNATAGKGCHEFNANLGEFPAKRRASLVRHLTSTEPSARRLSRDLPSAIWVLGLGSLMMDASSELIHSLLPAFMASTLGASVMTIGLIEGIAEATAAITKLFSGVISDFVGKRKFLVVLGYGMATLTKPIFPLARSISWVLAARFLDRVGKGIRGAPRDALIADITPAHLTGAAYGLRQSLDSVGAVVGPVAAFLFMDLLKNDIRSVLWVATIPAAIAVALFVLGIAEPQGLEQGRTTTSAKRGFAATKLPFRFWLVVGLGGLFTLARFSQSFLLLRAQDVGLSVGYVPLVMIVMNIVFAAAAYPAGIVADLVGRQRLLVAGLVVLILADLLFAEANTPALVFIGAAFWGLHFGLTEGLFAKLVADTVPAELRGTAFGIFNFVSGVALLAASALAGVLWTTLGPVATFLAGAVFAGLTVVGLAGGGSKRW
jgi:MFS family permease